MVPGAGLSLVAFLRDISISVWYFHSTDSDSSCHTHTHLSPGILETRGPILTKHRGQRKTGFEEEKPLSRTRLLEGEPPAESCWCVMILLTAGSHLDPFHSVTTHFQLTHSLKYLWAPQERRPVVQGDAEVEASDSKSFSQPLFQSASGSQSFRCSVSSLVGSAQNEGPWRGAE